jgi:hypothetical protein
VLEEIVAVSHVSPHYIIFTIYYCTLSVYDALTFFYRCAMKKSFMHVTAVMFIEIIS